MVDTKKCSEAVCSYKGKCVEAPLDAGIQDKVCDCHNGYVGRFCEKCSDSEALWPDCSVHYQMNVLEKKYASDTKEGCPHETYPKDLGRPEYLGMNGEMHIAGLYTISAVSEN